MDLSLVDRSRGVREIPSEWLRSGKEGSAEEHRRASYRFVSSPPSPSLPSRFPLRCVEMAMEWSEEAVEMRERDRAVWPSAAVQVGPKKRSVRKHSLFLRPANVTRLTWLTVVVGPTLMFINHWTGSGEKLQSSSFLLKVGGVTVRVVSGWEMRIAEAGVPRPLIGCFPYALYLVTRTRSMCSISSLIKLCIII